MKIATYGTRISQIIEADLGKGRQQRNRLFWRCPFHQDDSPSLTICPDGEHWKCFGCGESGDAIDWLRKRQGLGFKEAQAALGIELTNTLPAKKSNAAPKAKSLPAAPPAPAVDWQTKAMVIVEAAERTLWSSAGVKVLEWLHNRGLNDETIRAARLGYQAESGDVQGLFVDRGILIPWFADGVLRFVQVRRPSSDPKYRAIAGGARGSFYPAEPRPGRPMLATEGEFDALLVRQHAGDLVEAITLGGASDKLNEASATAVLCAPVVLVATDSDAAGEKAAKAWQTLTARARRCRPPIGKDVTEAVAAEVNLREWVVALLGGDQRKERGEKDGGQSDHKQKSAGQVAIYFSNWVYRNGGWQSPDYDWDRWFETLDNGDPQPKRGAAVR